MTKLRSLAAVFAVAAVAAGDAWAVAPPCAGVRLEELVRTEDVRPFTSNGSYVNDYDRGILHLPFYFEAISQHMRWIEALPPHPRIIEAGGGTGNMTIAARIARPDAAITLFDISPEMTKYAVDKGVPSQDIAIGTITDLRINGERVPEASVDHVFSHSVIWGLPNPEAFFAEAARVLKPGGTLGVSTAKNLNPSVDAELFNGFIHYLEAHLDHAVARGDMTVEQRNNFVDSNRNIIPHMKSPLSREQLIAMAKAHGFELVEEVPCYRVPTPHGVRSAFLQMLFRRPTT